MGVALSLAIGCGDDGEPEVGEVQAEVEEGAVVFSWDAGTIHMLTVLRCDSDCNGCGADGKLDYGAAAVMWQAAPDPFGAGEPELESPLTYGASPIAGAEEAGALESGETYGVEIWLAEECTESGCAPITMQACAEFVAP